MDEERQIFHAEEFQNNLKECSAFKEAQTVPDNFLPAWLR